MEQDFVFSCQGLPNALRSASVTPLKRRPHPSTTNRSWLSHSNMSRVKKAAILRTKSTGQPWMRQEFYYFRDEKQEFSKFRSAIRKKNYSDLFFTQVFLYLFRNRKAEEGGWALVAKESAIQVLMKLLVRQTNNIRCEWRWWKLIGRTVKTTQYNSSVTSGSLFSDRKLMTFPTLKMKRFIAVLIANV